ncbi:MAG: hypothetical protein KF802_03035 [Bdellovibrionaceae bacterium]|nr:hypothetical protein [Pseudobdellovibrionaceae bacterium]MBX3033854.1 hypothetical protein [Pseudobdellovibrionaceae bacterium]
MPTTRSYRTAKGTELPLLNLRGKEYLEVKYRLVWFREDHPDWSIETELISVTDVSAYARATIRDEAGRIIATSHKFESIQGFPDFIEKAETGAIGRALALIGYGTQFCADELDEGSRIVDAPVPSRQRGERFMGPTAARDRGAMTAGNRNNEDPSRSEDASAAVAGAEAEAGEMASASEPGDYLINFGRKYKGRKVKEIPKSELQSYLRWLENSDVRPGTPLAHQVKFLRDAFEKLYAPAEQQQPAPPAAH